MKQAWVVRSAEGSRPVESGWLEEVTGREGDDAGSGGTELSDRLRSLRAGRDFMWIALTDPTAEEAEAVWSDLELPRLQLEDALNPRQRAKIELLDHRRVMLVLKRLRYIAATREIETDQVSVFVGPHVVVTVSLGSPPDFSQTRSSLSEGAEVSEYGPVAVLHQLLDEAVDGYLAAVEQVTGQIEEIEESVFAPGRGDDSEAIYRLKRENLEIRRAVAPLLPGARRLARNEWRHLPPSLRPYFRDVADHVLRAADSVDSNDSLLMAMLMAATARADLEQNQDMRRISAWVAIAVVPTMIAGIYGMNFEDMPELHWAVGYPAILVAMAAVCTYMHHRFRRAGWL